MNSGKAGTLGIRNPSPDDSALCPLSPERNCKEQGQGDLSLQQRLLPQWPRNPPTHADSANPSPSHGPPGAFPPLLGFPLHLREGVLLPWPGLGQPLRRWENQSPCIQCLGAGKCEAAWRSRLLQGDAGDRESQWALSRYSGDFPWPLCQLF